MSTFASSCHCPANAVGAEIYFEDESGISLNVFTGKTWAPRGKTPTVYRSGQRTKRTIASAMSTEGRMYFRTLSGSMTGPRYRTFLKQLSRTRKQHPFFIIHDGLPAHRSRIVREYVESTHGMITIFQLPGYSPELNPTEIVWMNLQRELSKRTHKNVEVMTTDAERVLRSMKRKPNTVRRFVTHVYGDMSKNI